MIFTMNLRVKSPVEFQFVIILAIFMSINVL